MSNIKGQSWKERGMLEPPRGLSLTREDETGVYIIEEGKPPIHISITKAGYRVEYRSKLAIGAPDDCLILRGELLKRRLSPEHQTAIIEQRPVTSELLKALEKLEKPIELEGAKK